MNQVTHSSTSVLGSCVHVVLQHHNAKHVFKCAICFKHFSTERVMIQVRPFMTTPRAPQAHLRRVPSTAKQAIDSVVPTAQISS